MIHPGTAVFAVAVSAPWKNNYKLRPERSPFEVENHWAHCRKYSLEIPELNAEFMVFMPKRQPGKL